MKTLEHPVFGQLLQCSATTSCDWVGNIVLPSFAECYEKWCDDCTEFHHDRRSEAHRRGEFSLMISTGRLPTAGWKNTPDEDIEPTASQVAAFKLMTERHEALADSLAEQVAKFVRQREFACFAGGMGWFTGDEEDFERLLQRDMILGTLELQGIGLFTRSRGGVAYAGFCFHSEIWEPEHGVGAIVLGDQVIRMGAAEEAAEGWFPPFDDDDALPL